MLFGAEIKLEEINEVILKATNRTISHNKFKKFDLFFVRMLPF